MTIDKDFVIKNYEKMTVPNLALRFGVTTGTMTGFCYRLGLRKISRAKEKAVNLPEEIWKNLEET